MERRQFFEYEAWQIENEPGCERLFIKVCLRNLTHYGKEKKERDT
jgi:hypothetical protein